MKVRATQVCFVDGHRRRAGAVFTLKRGEKDFMPEYMSVVSEEEPETAVPSAPPRAPKPLSFTEFIQPVAAEKKPKAEKSQPGKKSTGDQEVI